MPAPEFYAGRPVSSLQTMLRLISETDTRILPIVPDGIYGANTYASVLSFQDAYGLPLTGETDLLTWDTIVRAYDRAVPQTTSPTLSPIWSTARTVEPGQSNYHIYLVQAMLAALSDLFQQLTPPELNGILDETTQQGLRWIQGASALSQTGALDTVTWNHLNALYRAVIKDGRK